MPWRLTSRDGRWYGRRCAHWAPALGIAAVTPLVIMAVVAAMITTELLPGGPRAAG
ncbi:hypothetical protein AB4039_30125 [Streptomyces sp. M-16]|uniref:hypothetical protein n=1 Tax=Streptomyces sp. M-16 TaxID=3233040 RepID=UPI003F945779